MAAAAGAAALSLLAEWRYRRLPLVRATSIAGPLPSLSVIVPARDEVANLPRLLRSLSTCAYPGAFEVIVVDDGSTDGTAAVAERHGARVLRLEGPPPGWLGKPHACHRGAAVARAEWLLFTDADTVHRADGPAQAVAWAMANDLDGLSVFPGHEQGIWADGPVLAAAFAGYFAGLQRPATLLNGQYILVRRAVYEASGGFAAVRGEPLEDLALGERLVRLAYRVPVGRGEGLVSVRMYTSAGQMWHGLTRLAALSLRWSGFGALLTALCTSLIAAPLGALAEALIRRRGRRRALAAWLLTCAGLIPWLARFDAGRTWLLAPVAGGFVQAAGSWGLLTRLLGLGIRWKGRAL